MRLPIVITALILLSACSRQKILVSVQNLSDFERNSEMVEVDASRALSAFGEKFVVRNSDKDEVAYQVTHDGKLIFLADVAARSTSDYTISSGTPAAVDTVAVGIYRPDCQDDFAWENEHGGYRLYGPVFRRGGGKVYGYDIWTKSVAYPILSKRYDDDHKRGISYHVDHGDGFDGYTVGPTLGGGMNAPVSADGEICYPCAYKSYELLDNGPLRMTVKFTVDSILVDGRYLTETRMIRLDAGSWFNLTTTTYDEAPKSVVAGIAIHSDNTNYTLNKEFNYISYADQTDNVAAGNGEIYVGLLASTSDNICYKPFPTIVANAVGQILLYNNYGAGTPFQYYWGSAWSKGGVASIGEWNKLLEAEAVKIKSPLKVTVR